MTFKEKVKILVNDEIKFKKLENYVNLIEEKNKVMNLTGFTDDKLWEEGIYESLISLEKFPIQGKLLDIGAGAGFPSVPFLIVHPEVELTIFEPIKKRTEFLSMVFNELDLKANIEIIRAEQSNKENNFDFITARAVAPLYALIEISYKVAKQNGVFIWIKGPNYLQEIEEAKDIISKLSLKLNVLKLDEIEKKNIFLISYSKEKVTPKNFPREWNKIIKN